MDYYLDLDKIAKNLEVKQAVLECLHEYVPYRDTFQYLTSVSRNSAFWNLIDESLPSNISLELHSIEASIPCTDRDFPQDTLSPYFQDFWTAYEVQKSGEVNFQCPFAATQFTIEDINEILSAANNGWEKGQNSTWTLYDQEISDLSLIMMCNAYISGTKPYLFCDIDEIRERYIECEKIMNKTDKSFDISSCFEAMRLFTIINGDDFANMFKGLNFLPKFSLSRDVLYGLSHLMTAAGSYFESKSNFPQYQDGEEWIKSRANHLANQMSMPFEKRYAFVETSQMLQARSGQPVDQPFDKYSIAELLFSNNNGDVMPLPYVSGKTEIQSGSSVPFCHAAFRKFVSRQLLESGYETTTDSVIDILADFSRIFVKKVAQDAAAIKKGSKQASTRDILDQALLKNQSGIVANPHFPNKTT